MNAVSTREPLAVLKRRLTSWYASTLGLILLALGGGLYALIHQQLSEQLDRSLAGAAHELMRAAQTREEESASANGAVVDAVDELHIPERLLFLLDSAGNPVIPNAAGRAVREAALRAAQVGVARDVDHLRHDHILSIHAERFVLKSGRTMVAVAAADQEELSERYAALIAAFGGAAAFAVVLSTIGGHFFVQQAIAPAERSIAYTRRFVADAAHELRTPISVLRTKTEVAMQRERSQAEYHEILSDVNREALRLGRVTDDLLMLARADAGVRPPIHAHMFLDDVVLDAAQSIQTLAQAANVSLGVEDFEETPISGDQGLIRELVVILLDNAVKFTPSGGKVTVRVRPDPQPTLVVEDSGMGITPEQSAHVFDRFFRGDPSRPRDKGAGLGLSIAQWIASVHNAQIKLAPGATLGTIATVTFQKVA